VAPSTVRLAVAETLVQEVAKSAAGVHGPLKILKHFLILMFFNSVRPHIRVPHISLVFREMWDSTALNP